MAPCRCLDGHVKEPYEMSMTCEPDRRSNVFFSPPTHLCDVTSMWRISLGTYSILPCITEVSLNVTNPLHSNAKLTTNTTMDIHGTSWHQVPRKESASPKVSTSVEWIYPNTNVHIHITKHGFVLTVCLFAVCLLSTLTFSMTLKCKRKGFFLGTDVISNDTIAQWDSY